MEQMTSFAWRRSEESLCWASEQTASCPYTFQGEKSLPPTAFPDSITEGGWCKMLIPKLSWDIFNETEHDLPIIFNPWNNCDLLYVPTFYCPYLGRYSCLAFCPFLPSRSALLFKDHSPNPFHLVTYVWLPLPPSKTYQRREKGPTKLWVSVASRCTMISLSACGLR